MADYENNNIAMGWDDTIENDSSFTLLPEGDYDFEVTKFERGRFEGSKKMCACPMAILSLKCTGNGESSTITHNLMLNKKMEWKLCEFFTAIGDRKHGEQLRPNWGALLGKKGRCKIGIREWTNDKGEAKKSNEITKFYEPADTPTSAGKTFVPGKF